MNIIPNPPTHLTTRHLFIFKNIKILLNEYTSETTTPKNRNYKLYNHKFTYEPYFPLKE